ncbi:sensor histidine kinase [Streptomonospora alba]|uniref:sensor histidine kinase n=1 Tax=Streptomonospora alba TaxID=183763 RepID=UPI00069A18BD|nr:histidine kinase [Streptomonospora alba]
MSGEERSTGDARSRRGGSAAAAGAARDALWRRPADVPRWLPADGAAADAPVLGGVCAALAARSGRPAPLVRRRFAKLVAPALAYPLLWLVRLAERPDAEGRERFDGTLFLAAAALGTAAASAAQLSLHGVPAAVSAVLGVALGAPLLALSTSVLLTWRWMTAALLLTALMTATLPPAAPPLPGIPVPAAAAALYLLVLYLAGTQYARPVAAAVGGCGAATTAAAAAAGSAPAGVWSAAAAAAVVLVGDNVRMRRAHADQLRTAPGGGPGRSAPPVPAADPGGASTPQTGLPGGARENRPGDDGGSAAAGAASTGPPGPASAVRAVADALWRTPGALPRGPLRLVHGPRRPVRGRVAAGVCAGLARGSQPMTLVLRVLFPLVSFPVGIVVYLLLWVVLPRADEAPDEDGEAGPDDGGRLPPVQPREVTAWFLLLGVGGGIAALVAVQLVQFHRVDTVFSILLGLVVGLPFALLPVAPLTAWRIMAAGLFAVLIAVGASAPPSHLGSAYTTPYELWPWPVAALVALPVVLYAVAVNHPGRTTVGVGLVTVGADIAAASPLVGTHPGQVLWIAAVAAAVLLFGYNVRSRRTAQRRLAEESALRRQDRARQAVLEERSRIARELHDVVSHHMSMIAIQADAAPYKFPDLTPGPAATFTTLRDAARDALAEMRRVVGLLREEDEAPEDAPQPGLGTLPDLVESARRAAVDVRLEGGADAAREAARGLPGAVDVSAYRIVQESVSNAGRHAPGATVVVGIERTAATLTVRVANGPAPTPGDADERGGAPPAVFDRGGHGLVGMRERVAMLGGRLRAAPTADGGFDVVAELPVDGGPAGTAEH